MAFTSQKKSFHSKLSFNLGKLTSPESSTSRSDNFDFSEFFGSPLASSFSPSSSSIDPQIIHNRSHSFIGPSPGSQALILSLSNQIDTDLSSYDDEERNGGCVDEVGLGTGKDERAKIGLGDFEILRVMGKGAFGKVFQVRKSDKDGGVGCGDDGLYAMKVMRKETIIKNNHMYYMKAERDILTKVVHRFIVKLRYSFQVFP